jgi:hypothetical protein
MIPGIATTTARPRTAITAFIEYSIMAKVGTSANDTR